MRNIRLTLEYDGTGFAGWQWQPGLPTLQGAVEDALARLVKEPVRVTAAGRTDAGVHALGQVVNFATGCRVPLRGFLHGLNGLLPPAVAVREAAEVPPEFDSRHSARGKTYQYFLHVGGAPSAFARRTSWRPGGALDLAAMAAAGRRLVGTHDFEAFRSAGCDAAHAVRTIVDLWVRERGEYVEIGVQGNGFLRHMVRIMVGTLVDIARGRREPGSVDAALATGERTRAGPTAPPQGLFLAAVRYEMEVLGRCP